MYPEILSFHFLSVESFHEGVFGKTKTNKNKKGGRRYICQLFFIIGERSMGIKNRKLEYLKTCRVFRG